MKRIYTILFAAALTAGCNNKPKENKEPPPTPTTASGSATAGSAGSAAGSDVAAGSAGSAGSGSGDTADLEVPTEVDFEAEAQAKITDKNLEAEVKALEEQLAQ